ncbi:MAG TPA: TolC family protein, partial [Spirochaetota bacterium]|nr:TolC family protein [Spirochaetota bacterium]
MRSLFVMKAFVIFIILSAGLLSAEENATFVLPEKKETTLVLDYRSSISIGVSNSFDLKEIRARESIYDLSIYETIREYFPSLNFSYLQTEESRRRESDDRESRFTVESEFPVYDGGRRGLNYDVAKLNSLLARNDYRIALNELMVSIRGEYLNLLKLRETVTINKQAFERGQMQLSFIQKEFELGDATKLSVLEIEAKVKEIELSKRQSENDYDSALKKFKLLLRIDRKVPVDIRGDVDKDFVFVPVNGLIDEELVSIALKKRKEIESSDVKYEISRLNNLINERYYFPNVSLGFNYNLTGEEFPPREKGWGVNVKFTSRAFGNSMSAGTGYSESGNSNSRGRSSNASVDVLNDMPYKRNILESRLEAARAADETVLTRESIAINVSISCMAMRDSWDMIGIAGKRLELYDSQLEIERLKANMGESRRYDILEKEIERRDAAIALLDSKIKYLTAASDLELSVGMDVDFFKNYMKEKGAV